MSSLLKAFKEFYNEINGATLTGAIDVIVVELADGSFVCSPFHVRFGKLGVLRSREKIVDIEVNGEPVNIHMKLGESGEAFFVQECHDNDLDELPSNLATSPLPSEEFASNYNECHDDQEKGSIEVKIRRNSTVSSQSDKEKVYENQSSDYKTRRYSEKVLNRRNPKETRLEYTTEQIRHGLNGKQAVDLLIHDNDAIVAQNKTPPDTVLDVATIIEEQADKHCDAFGDKIRTDNMSGTTNTEISIIDSQKSITKDNETVIKNLSQQNLAITTTTTSLSSTTTMNVCIDMQSQQQQQQQPEPITKEATETKSKKKRRKKSMMKKKASITSTSSGLMMNINSNNNQKSTASRKSSSSSSAGSSIIPSDPNEVDIEMVQHSSNATLVSSIDDLAKTVVPSIHSIDKIPDNSCVNDPMETSRMCDFHFFSDTEVAASPYGSRPSTPIQSDSELEISQRDSLVKNEKNSDPMSSSTASWKWGEFPITPAKADADTVNDKDAKQAERQSTLHTMLSFMKETIKMRKNTSEGVYLSDLMDTDGLDPDIVAKYFPPAKTESYRHLNDGDESGNGTSLPHSPSSIENGTSKSLEFDFELDGKLYEKNVIAFSLCGGLENNGPTEEEFENHVIEYSDVCRDPSIFMSPQLVVRLCNKFYSWAAASSIVMTTIAYRKPLTSEAIDQLITSNKGSGTEADQNKQNINLTESEQKDANQSNNRRSNASGYSWWKWRRSTDSNDKNLPQKGLEQRDSKLSHQISENTEENSVTENSVKIDAQNDQSMETEEIDMNGTDNFTSRNVGIENLDNVDSVTKNDDSISSELADVSKTSFSSEKYRKTLRLTSEQIESLNLKPGMNELGFSVTTAYQGTSRCKCYVFRWKHTDKVVISDIDGTITKSDVLGHILPMVGKDWAQLGVAELFTKIEKNGYKLLYLSARAIGQSRATRDYLRSIQQGNVKLPDGPLLLNPTSLISAFHREVIERKPEQFKIACLSDIKALFPENPFYAGYGNRINDVWAYCAVGIPVIRIFTINPKGELKHELNKTFQSTYHNMAYIVDQLFPPVNDREESVEFSSFNYWREPFLDISDCDQLLDTTMANLSAQQITPSVSVTTTPTISDNDIIPDKA